MKYKEVNQLFNFREIEKIVKNSLIRSGYKPPVKKRMDILRSQEFKMTMKEAELSAACSEDFQHFIKLYVEFLDKCKEAHEVNDISRKMLNKFNYAFIRGGAQNSEGTDLKDYTMIKLFLRNMVVWM